MQALPKSRLFRFVEQAFHLAPESCRPLLLEVLKTALHTPSAHRFTLPQSSEKHDWWKQFRELTIICLTHNLDRSL
ncbi:hypothetical protein SAMN05443574_12519 [Haloarcula vallismortis]|uniref:Uncharacterized protein n=1 Tax=Haloarcula vallismortis TaxID=28442 RepID=A0A1H3AI09_HALVA|nr:hypothetical protein SAMN05443574_12519 [Haloarcula vallismortis]